MRASRLRNVCIGDAIVAAAFAVLSGTGGLNPQLLGPWMVACWVFINMAVAFHLEVDK